MASICGACFVSPSSSLACHQYGSRISYLPTHRFPLLKLSDIAYNSYSSSLSVKAQVASLTESVQTELPAISEKLDSPASELPDSYAHLSPLINELADGGDVFTAMDPWLGKLSLQDWDALVRRLGGADCTTSWKIVSFFKEKAPLLDESVLWPKHVTSGAQMVEGEDSDEGEDRDERQSYPSSEAVAETSSHDGSIAREAQDKSLTDSMKNARILILYKTLAKVLGKNKKFDELDQLQEQMKNEGIEPNFSLYNALLNLYTLAGLAEKAFELVLKMDAAGFQPPKHTYQQVAYMHMNKKNPDLTAATSIMKDLMGRGLTVDVGIFKNLLKAYWRMKDTAGVEEVFQAMQVAGYSPDLKVLLKVMYCHKQNGNYERILELMEMITNWGLKPNVGVYDQLVYAYCKAGSPEKAKETLLEYESVLGRKPTLVSLNMLVNGYGKQGLYEEAMQIFDEIQKNAYRPSVVSYTSAISVLVCAQNMNKAAQLYRRMVKRGLQPTLYTYLTLIRGYTKLNWTREGRKIANALRRSPIKMTPEAYGVILSLFVEGNWYVHAASILKEMEKDGVAWDFTATASLIQSFSVLGNKPTPLAKAVEESNMEVCTLLTALFISKPDDLKLETVAEETLLSYLEKFKDKDEGRALIYNAFMECFWRKGFKTLARRVLSSARKVYAKHTQPQLLEAEWVLDLRGLSVGGAKVALTEWLTCEDKQKEEKPKGDQKMVLITGDDFQINVVQDNRVLKTALNSMLGDLGSPFVESQDDSKKLEANASEVMKWVQSDKVKEVLNFIDEPSTQ